MKQTVDQQRAAFAWQCASTGMRHHEKEYKPLAKGGPALIMTSGLMPTLAFYSSKGGAAKNLRDDIILWLAQRPWMQPVQLAGSKDAFEPFMLKLQTCDTATYLRATDEALEILKWIRQFVDAVK